MIITMPKFLCKIDNKLMDIADNQTLDTIMEIISMNFFLFIYAFFIIVLGENFFNSIFFWLLTPLTIGYTLFTFNIKYEWIEFRCCNR